MINLTVLVGRLTKEPELRRTQSGTSVVSYTLAVNRKSKKDGQPETDFISCVAWNKTADLMAQYLHKGSLIGIEGSIQTRYYDNQQGQRIYVTEVVTNKISFLESKNIQEAQQTQPQYQQPSTNNNESDLIKQFGGDLPF